MSKELEEAIEKSEKWLDDIKSNIGDTGYWETEGALRCVIKAAKWLVRNREKLAVFEIEPGELT